MGSNDLRFIIKAKDEASRVLRGIGGGFSSLGKVAKIGMAVATSGVMLLIAAITALIGFVLDAKRVYEEWMGTLDDMQDVTGMSAKATSILAFQARMADTDVGALTKGVGIFTKMLDAARQGTGTAVDAFKRLGVNLRDADGKFRSLDDVLFEARDKLSQVRDQVTRNGIAAKLFGKGFAAMADWLDKSAGEMKKYVKWAKELGMVMGEKSMAAFQKYRENQRKLSVGWDAIKINAYGALVPLINKLMPDVIKGIWKAAGWLRDFRRLAEKKGLGDAVREMIPGFDGLADAAQKALDWLRENLPKAFKWLKENGPAIADALVRVSKWLTKTSDSGSNAGRTFSTVRKILGTLNPILGLATGAFGSMRSIISRVSGAAKTVIGWLGKVKDALDSGFSTGPLSAVYSAISSIIGVAQRAYDLIQKVLHSKGNMSGGGGGGGGGGGFGTDAYGGYYTRPRATVVGDNGPAGEVVLPLDKPRRIQQILAEAGLTGGGSSGTVVNVYLDGDLIESHVTGRQSARTRRLARGFA